MVESNQYKINKFCYKNLIFGFCIFTNFWRGLYVYTDAGIRPAIFMMLSWFAAFEIIGEANEPTYVVVYYIFKKQWSKQISMHFPNNTFFSSDSSEENFF